MKTLTYLIVLLLSLSFGGCDKDDDDTTIIITNPPPTPGVVANGQYRFSNRLFMDENYVVTNNDTVTSLDSSMYIYFYHGQFLKQVSYAGCNESYQDFLAMFSGIAIIDTVKYDPSKNTFAVQIEWWDGYSQFLFTKSNYAPMDTVICN